MADLQKSALLLVLGSTFLHLISAETRTIDGPSKVIESFHIKSDIRFRFATTMMTSVVRNDAAQAQEIPFDVTLPKEAFIVNFSMAIDGKEYIGEVKEKGAAKRQYTEAVKRGESAGHVRQAPRHSNVFQVAVNVANGSAVTFTLTYQELLRRKHGIYEHEIHVSPGQAVEDFSIEIFIQENRNIPFIKTPALRENVLLTNEVEEDNELTIIERPSPKTAHILYAPSLTEQGDKGVSARFALQYDVDHSDKGEVLVVDGYFLHFYAPDVEPLPKDIIFVLDVSGSMNGQKIKQLQTSMVTILKDVSPEDRINILTFSDRVKRWKRGLTLADSKVIRDAIKFVNGMRADGGTDINEALLVALSELRGRELTKRVGMIFFLTDGQPTSGTTNTKQITKNVSNANKKSASIFGLAFGNGADFNFIKAMCGQNSGFARKIYEASDSALQVASLYDEISAVVMKNVSVEYLPGIKKTTQTTFPTIFNGTEIVICGPFLREMNDRFVAKVSGIEKSGKVDVVLDIDDVNEVTMTVDDTMNTFFTMPRDFVGIIEKMWAFLTIKQQLLERERVVQDEVKAEKMKQEILAMSLQYRFVTPFTSMVVTKPGDKKEQEKLESGLEEAGSGVSPRRAQVLLGGRVVRRKSRKRGGGKAYVPASHVQSGTGGLKSILNQRKLLQPSIARFDPQFGLPSEDKMQFLDLNLSDLFPSASATPPPTFAPPKPIKRGRKRGNRKNRNNKRGKKKTKKQRVMLSSITVKSPTSSACLSVRRLLNGIYTLLEWQGYNTTDQLNIEMGMECVKKCRKVSPKSLDVSYNGNKAVIDLTSGGPWRYSQGHNLTVRLIGQNQLKVATPGAEIVIDRTQVKRKILYDVEVVLKARAKIFKGLLGQIMRLSSAKKRRSKKGRVSKVCLKRKADISMKLKKKFASGFRRAPGP